MTYKGLTKRWTNYGDYDHTGHLNRWQKKWFARKERYVEPEVEKSDELKERDERQ